MNIADWHRHYYQPERPSDLIRHAAKRDLAHRASRHGTDEAPPSPDRASEFIADYVREEHQRPTRDLRRLERDQPLERVCLEGACPSQSERRDARVSPPLGGEGTEDAS